MTTEKSDLDEFDGLAALADEGAAQAAGEGVGDVAIDTGPDYQLEAAQCVDTVGALICGYAPDAGPFWSDESKAAMKAAAAPVFEKYKWTLGSMPPELILALAVGPALYQSAKIIALKMQKDRAKADKATTQVESRTPATDSASLAAGQHDQVKLYANG